MRISGSIVSSAKRAFSWSRDNDSVTRNEVRLCMKTVTAPSIRNVPIASATMSSISVIPCWKRRFMRLQSSKIRNTDHDLVRDGTEAYFLPRDLNGVGRRRCGAVRDGAVRRGQLLIDLGVPNPQIVLRHLRGRASLGICAGLAAPVRA